MRGFSTFLSGIALLTLITINPVFAQDELSEHLQVFKPFIGKTYKGAMTDTAKKSYDVSKWERALNGQAIRNLHSINDGEYGGETIIYWDKEKEQLIYYYFTTAGFYTQGTMTVEGKKFISHEYVTGNKEGVTEVKAVGEILPDGRMHMKSSYLQNGVWVGGHEFYYVEAPDAKVIFK